MSRFIRYDRSHTSDDCAMESEPEGAYVRFYDAQEVEEQRDAALALIRTLATADGIQVPSGDESDTLCAWCGCSLFMPTEAHPHAPNCPWVAARLFLAKHGG